jgi:hypothetical protein
LVVSACKGAAVINRKVKMKTNDTNLLGCDMEYPFLEDKDDHMEKNNAWIIVHCSRKIVMINPEV